MTRSDRKPCEFTVRSGRCISTLPLVGKREVPRTGPLRLLELLIRADRIGPVFRGFGGGRPFYACLDQANSEKRRRYLVLGLDPYAVVSNFRQLEQGRCIAPKCAFRLVRNP